MNNKKEQINNILSIVKLCSLLFAGMIVFREIFRNAATPYSTAMLSGVLGGIMLPSIYFLWMFWTNKSSALVSSQRVAFAESIAFVLIFGFVIYISGAVQSNYKFLLLLVIVSSSIQLGMKRGIIISILSSVVVLGLDLLTYRQTGVNEYFEIDVVLIGIFILVAWTLGFFVKIINEYILQLEYWANTDNLTGVFNHRYFSNMLKIKLESARENASPLSFMFIDIDYFKNYNDLNGHQKGDNVLKSIGDLLRIHTRRDDIVARYGGEEFVVIMPDTDEETASGEGEKIRDIIENTYFENQENQPNGNLTVSVGISSFPSKAGNEDELIRSADDALYRAKFFNKNRVESYSSILDELKNNMEENDIDLISSIKTLISIINIKDRYTYGHSERVVAYCRLISEQLDLDDPDAKNLIYAAYLHDIGKVDIPIMVLNKQSALSPEEWDIMKQHPTKGAEIISPIQSIQSIIPIIKHHHEKYDGGGYPDGLAGENIPYFARVLSIADCFDAMMSDRPYHKRKTYEDAIKEIVRCKNTQFDPALVDAFIEVLEKNKERLRIN